VWAASLANIEVPKEYWWLVEKHWLDTQIQDGGWNYSKSAMTSTATMTAAGLASMFVCFDNLFTKGFIECNTQNEFKPIKRGLDWFDKNFEDTMKAGGGGIPSPQYFLYGVERVGLASGYKYFGTSDWYKMGVEMLLKQQDPATGCWNGDIVQTAFSVLFLIRGRNAVLFNKLEYDGDWNNRPRDVAMETRWITRDFERTVNWQIIIPRCPSANGTTPRSCTSPAPRRPSSPKTTSSTSRRTSSRAARSSPSPSATGRNFPRHQGPLRQDVPAV